MFNLKALFLCLFVLLILFCIALFLIFLQEKGKIPKPERQKRFATLKYNDTFYYTNNHFINIFEPIMGFKNVDKNAYQLNTTLLKMLFSKQKNVNKKIIKLSKKDFNEKPDNFSVRWLGHSNTIIELNGKRMIIDPVFGNAAPIPFVVKRNVKPPIKLNKIKNKIDFVVITHNHYDHLEKNSVMMLKNKHFIIPIGVKETLQSWGVKDENIIELAWGDTITLDKDIKITAEPTMHFSGRTFSDRNMTLWNAYVIETKNKKIFWSGDGGYGKQFDLFAQKYGKFDLIAVEIDAWNEKWPYAHMFPQEVIEITKKLKADCLLPIHYGVFNLAMHDYSTSIDYLNTIAKQDKDFNSKILNSQIGEKIVFEQ